MPREFQPITKASWLVRVQDLDVYWSTFSGIKDSSNVGRYSDGFSRDLLPLVGPAELQDITFTRGYDPRKDDDIVSYWRSVRGNGGEVAARSITVQAVSYEPDPIALGAPFVLYDFRATGFEIADVDKTSQENASMVLTGVCSYWDKRPTNTPITL